MSGAKRRLWRFSAGFGGGVGAVGKYNNNHREGLYIKYLGDNPLNLRQQTSSNGSSAVALHLIGTGKFETIGRMPHGGQ